MSNAVVIDENLMETSTEPSPPVTQIFNDNLEAPALITINATHRVRLRRNLKIIAIVLEIFCLLFARYAATIDISYYLNVLSSCYVIIMITKFDSAWDYGFFAGCKIFNSWAYFSNFHEAINKLMNAGKLQDFDFCVLDPNFSRPTCDERIDDFTRANFLIAIIFGCYFFFNTLNAFIHLCLWYKR